MAQCVYVYRFLVELWHLIGFAVLQHAPPEAVLSQIGGAEAMPDAESLVMLSVLGLIDVVMIANLLIMVIVGGY